MATNATTQPMLSVAENPTILLLPASFTPSSFYVLLQTLLWHFNYPTLRIPIPSVIESVVSINGSKVPPVRYPTMEDDVQAVQTVLAELIEGQNKNVVIVTHSYSGIVGTEAIKKFSKKEREASGLAGKGGVTDIIYVASLVPYVGKSAGTVNPVGFPGYVLPEDEGKLLGINASEAAPPIFNDFPSKEALFWAQAMGYHSTVAFTGNLTFPAWNYVNVTYVLTGNDEVLAPAVQNGIIQMMNEDLNSKGRKVNIFERFTGHMAVMAHPDWIASIIRRVCGEDA